LIRPRSRPTTHAATPSRSIRRRFSDGELVRRRNVCSPGSSWRARASHHVSITARWRAPGIVGDRNRFRSHRETTRAALTSPDAVLQARDQPRPSRRARLTPPIGSGPYVVGKVEAGNKRELSATRLLGTRSRHQRGLLEFRRDPVDTSATPFVSRDSRRDCSICAPKRSGRGRPLMIPAIRGGRVIKEDSRRLAEASPSTVQHAPPVFAMRACAKRSRSCSTSNGSSQSDSSICTSEGSYFEGSSCRRRARGDAGERTLLAVSRRGSPRRACRHLGRRQ